MILDDIVWLARWLFWTLCLIAVLHACARLYAPDHVGAWPIMYLFGLPVSLVFSRMRVTYPHNNMQCHELR